MEVTDAIDIAVDRAEARVVEAPPIESPPDKAVPRYPGAPPFQDTAAHHGLFFGRDDEIEGLYQRLLSTRLLVLYGASGLGKTSLLKAGLFPKMRTERRLLPLYLLVRQSSMSDLIAEIAEIARAQPEIDFVPGECSSLWEFFKTSLFWHGDTLVTPVLVLDQFEEVFTVIKNKDFRLELAAEIGSLLSRGMPRGARERAREQRQSGNTGLSDSPPDVKVILSLREEYVGALQELAPKIPALLQERFRLLPLSRECAKKAIEQPAEVKAGGKLTLASPTFTYDSATLDMMLGFLEGESGTIEPWQLQLLCQHVEQKVINEAATAAGPITIDDSMLGGKSGMESVIQDFYSRVIETVDLRDRGRVRKLCEDGLLTSDGYRRPLRESEIIEEYGVSERTLSALVEERLLRKETRLNSHFYELSHDSLARPILESRSWRLPRKWRQSLLAGGSVALIAFALLSAGAYQLYTAKRQAEVERDRAEQLVGFLIGEEWLEKLRATGRTEIIGDVLGGVEKYLADVPDASRNRESYLASGIAHRIRADLFVDWGKLQEAKQEFRTAEALFRQLTEREPENPNWKKEWAVTLVKRANAEREGGDLKESGDAARRAIELLGIVIGKGVPNVDEARRELAGATAALAETLDDAGATGEALKTFEALVALCDEMISKSPAAARWSRHLQEGLIGQGDIFVSRTGSRNRERAKQAYARALALAQDLRKRDPFDARNNVRYAFAINRIGNVQMEEGAKSSRYALDSYREIYGTFSELTRRDPKNLIWRRHWAVTARLLGEAHLELGEGDHALPLLRQASEVMTELAARDPGNAGWQLTGAEVSALLGRALAQTKNPEGALKAYETALASSKRLVEAYPSNRKYQVAHYRNLIGAADVLRIAERWDAALAYYIDAEAAIGRLVEIDPENAEYRVASAGVQQAIAALPVQGSVEHNLGRYQKALDNAEMALRLDDENHLAHNEVAISNLQIGRLHRDRGDPRQALDSYKKALTHAKRAVELKPDDQVLGKNLATTYIDFARATRASALDRKAPAATTLTHLRESLGMAENAIRLDPENSAGQNDVAISHLEVGRVYRDGGNNQQALESYKKALTHAKRAVELKPGDKVLTKNLAITYVDLARSTRTLATERQSSSETLLRESLGMAEDAIRLDPESFLANNELSLSHMQMGRLYEERSEHERVQESFGKALAYAKRAIELKPTDDVLTKNLASAYIGVSRGKRRWVVEQKTLSASEALRGLTDAVNAGENAVRIQPDSFLGHNELTISQLEIGRVYLDRREHQLAIGSFKKALAHAKRAVELAPQNKTLQANLVLAFWDHGEAQLMSGDALKKEYKQEPALKVYREATSDLTEALRLATARPEDRQRLSTRLGLAHGRVGALLLEMGEDHELIGDRDGALRAYRDSLSALEKAVQADPDDANLQLYLVNALRGQVRIFPDRAGGSQTERLAALDRAVSELRRLDQQGKLASEWKTVLRDLEEEQKRASAQR
jgi:tetratricopeptide (TPR) repeat protein